MTSIARLTAALAEAERREWRKDAALAEAQERLAVMEGALPVAVWAENNANLIPWCVHVLGPDDVHASRTHADAVRKAAALNAAMARGLASEPNDILCFAYAAPWPHSAESHTNSLAALAPAPPAEDR